jgi:hypothetical protein
MADDVYTPVPWVGVSKSPMVKLWAVAVSWTMNT